MKFVPLKTFSHYSLLRAISKPKQIVERCADLGYDACAITDYNSLSGCVQFVKACKAKKIKPILGCTFKLGVRNHTITLLAKNKKGWDNLICALNHYNAKIYNKENISIDDFRQFSGEWIALVGGPSSEFVDCLFVDSEIIYTDAEYDEVKKELKQNYSVELASVIEKYSSVLGKENLYIGIEEMSGIKAADMINNILRLEAESSGISCCYSTNSHYPSDGDASDHRVVLCSLLKTNLKELKCQIYKEDISLRPFVNSNRYHIPKYKEIKASKDELQNTIKISDLCEEYNILSNPVLPKFDCPNGLSNDEYLRQLCREGWQRKISPILESEEQKQIYVNRIKEELDVISKADLSGYFLIVQDYVNFARKNGWLVGPGRGSVGGSLIAYLIDITSINPIPHKLLFSRFYNAGRNTKDRVSLPDIDCDFPISKREFIIEYIKNKYGEDKVSQISTYSRMQGRSAMKDVLNAHIACSFDEMNKITEYIPDEAAIADQLQEMIEEEGHASIIKWALENNPEPLKEWAYIDENGEIQSSQGNYGNLFAQAIRLEGTKRSQGKHAAGVVISSMPLHEVCPMIYDKNTGQKIAAFEMSDLEAMGQAKMDILGVAALEKLMLVRDLLANGVCE